MARTVEAGACSGLFGRSGPEGAERLCLTSCFARTRDPGRRCFVGRYQRGCSDARSLDESSRHLSTPSTRAVGLLHVIGSTIRRGYDMNPVIAGTSGINNIETDPYVRNRCTGVIDRHMGTHCTVDASAIVAGQTVESVTHLGPEASRPVPPSRP